MQVRGSICKQRDVKHLEAVAGGRHDGDQGSANRAPQEDALWPLSSIEDGLQHNHTTHQQLSNALGNFACLRSFKSFTIVH